MEEGQLDYEKLGNYKRIIMSNSHIQRYSEFLSRPTSSPLQEKSLSDSDIDALIAKGEEVVKAIMRDDEKTSEEKKTAQSVLSWIQSVKSTWKDEKSLHPNAVTKLMKVTAIRQGKWGYSVPGGKIPPNFAN